jgi:hypothetical protein
MPEAYLWLQVGSLRRQSRHMLRHPALPTCGLTAQMLNPEGCRTREPAAAPGLVVAMATVTWAGARLSIGDALRGAGLRLEPEGLPRTCGRWGFSSFACSLALRSIESGCPAPGSMPGREGRWRPWRRVACWGKGATSV